MAINVESAFTSTYLEEINVVNTAAANNFSTELLKANQEQSAKYEKLKQDFERLQVESNRIRAVNAMKIIKYWRI